MLGFPRVLFFAVPLAGLRRDQHAVNFHETADLAPMLTVVHQKMPGDGYVEASAPHTLIYKNWKEYMQNVTGVPKAPPGFDEVSTAHVPAISHTMWCLLNAIIPFFVCQIILASLITGNVIHRRAMTFTTKVFIQAKGMAMLAPMMCVLFLAIRIRAVQLAGGPNVPWSPLADPDHWNLPPMYVKYAMQMSAFSLTLQVLFCTFQLCVPRDDHDDEEVGHLDKYHAIRPPKPWIHASVFFFMCVQYCATILAVYGLIVMKPPEALWGNQSAAMSPAVACTLINAVVYFIIYTVVFILRSMNDFFPTKATKADRESLLFYEDLTRGLQTRNAITKGEAVGTLAIFQVNVAPMTAVLCLIARMRALQLGVSPQPWAQSCMWITSFGLIFAVLFTVLPPMVFGASCRRGVSEGDITWVMSSEFWGKVLTALRYISIGVVYGSITAILVSIYTIEGPYVTPPVSTTVRMINILIITYYGVYIGVYVLETIKQFRPETKMCDDDDGIPDPASKLDLGIQTLEAARSNVEMSPMMCVLFLGTRMRALQITHNAGEPQGYVQNAMTFQVVCMCLQLFTTFLTPMTLGGTPDVDQDGSVLLTEVKHKTLYNFLTFLRYVFLTGVFTGTTIVLIGFFEMNPANATGEGKWLTGLK